MKKNILHDLRAPLARAKTLAKLLLEEESKEEREECVKLLLRALEEIDESLEKAFS